MSTGTQTRSQIHEYKMIICLRRLSLTPVLTSSDTYYSRIFISTVRRK